MIDRLDHLVLTVRSLETTGLSWRGELAASRYFEGEGLRTSMAASHVAGPGQLLAWVRRPAM